MNDGVTSPSAIEIRRQMAAIRRELPKNMERIVTGARQIFDWRQYVRDFPWASTLAAAAVGYWLVPARSRRSSQIERKFDEFVDRQRTAPPASEEKVELEKKAHNKGWLGLVMGFAGSAILRAGSAYLANSVTQLLAPELLQAGRQAAQRDSSWGTTTPPTRSANTDSGRTPPDMAAGESRGTPSPNRPRNPPYRNGLRSG